MYGKGDLAESPVFAGGFCNFGYWEDLADPPSIHARIEASRALYRQVLDALLPAPGNYRDVMEIGVGRGQGALLALESYPVEHIIGIDREPMQIERLHREQSDLVARARLAGRVGSAERLPVDSASVDAIYSVEALQHFEDRQAFVREAARALRPGGRLALTTFFLTHDKCLDQVRSMLPTVQRGITRLSTTTELEGYLHGGQFEDVRMHSIGAQVFPGFDRWLALIGRDAGETDSWGRNWLRCFQAGLIDYCVVVATRSETYA